MTTTFCFEKHTTVLDLNTCLKVALLYRTPCIVMSSFDAFYYAQNQHKQCHILPEKETKKNRTFGNKNIVISVFSTKTTRLSIFILDLKLNDRIALCS